MVKLRLRTAQVPHGCGHAALELVVVVRIEQIVFAAVLVLQHHVDRSEAHAESIVGGFARTLLGVGVTAPLLIRVRKIGVALPLAGVDQLLQACAIGTRACAEDTPARAAASLASLQTAA